MKILAINGSPRGKRSNTDRFLLPFLQGAKMQGAQIEEIYLSEKNIKGCQGCFSCWVKTQGKCMFKDDMAELMEKVNEADVLIFATPLYFYSMTSQMKAFLDRLLPLMEPYFINKNGRMSHPRRRENPWKIILFSNEGFVEKENFRLLVENFQIVAGALGDGKLDAAILRTTAEALASSPFLKLEFLKVKRALEEAGKEYVKNGFIADKTMAKIEKQVVGFDLDIIIKLGNRHWNQLIKKYSKETKTGA